MTQINPSPGELVHYGVKGMHWGIRKSEPTTFTKEQRKQARANVTAITRATIDSKYREGSDLFSRKMSQEEYNKLSSKAVVVKKGSELYRVTKRNNEKYGDMTYTSFTKSDRNTYRSVMPLVNSKNPFKLGGNKTYSQHYEITFKALETLKSPSEKERVDAFIGLMDSPTIKLRNGKTVTGREYMKRLYPKEVKTLNAQQLGLRAYKDFVETQFARTPLNSAYFKEVRDRGYNSIVDDQDRGHLSETPLMVLNPDGTMKKMSVRPLSADDINQAQLDLKMPPGKEYS